MLAAAEDAPMWLALIVLHAAAGLAAFSVGIAALNPLVVARHRWIPGAVVWMLVGLVVFMVGAMAAHWSALETASQIVFTGLVGLGCYMVWRARQARQTASTPIAERDRSGYVDDIGFVLISLFDGFIIVLALDLGAPAWLVAGGAIGAVLIGHHLVSVQKDRIDAPSAETPDHDHHQIDR